MTGLRAASSEGDSPRPPAHFSESNASLSAHASAASQSGRTTPSRRALLGLLLALVLGVGLRCIQLTEPYIADFHAWRQADSAAFTRGYLVETLNPFSPRVARQPCAAADAPFGEVEAELPIAAWISALPLRALGASFPPPWYLRLVAIGFYLLAAVYLWKFCKLLSHSALEASLAVLVFSTLPIAIFFTRTPQPDGPALAFSLGFLYHLERWLIARSGSQTPVGTQPMSAQPMSAQPTSAQPPTELPDQPPPATELLHGNARPRSTVRLPSTPHVQLWLSAAFGVCMLLIKVSGAFVGLTALFLVLSRLSLRQALKQWPLWLWGAAILSAAAAWSVYANTQFAWSFGVWGNRTASKFTSLEVLTSSVPWRTLSERLVFIIAGWPVVLLAAIGVGAGLGERRVRLCLVWLLAFAIYVLAVLKGHEVHVYYQLPLVLPLALLAARGAAALWGSGSARATRPSPQADSSPQGNHALVAARPSWIARASLLGLLCVHALSARSVMFAAATHGERRGFYHQDTRVIEGAELLHRSVPDGARFVSTDRHPALFFNSRRSGYFTESEHLKELATCAKGRATFLLIPSRLSGAQRQLGLPVKEVARSKHYTVWKLTE